MAIAVTLSNAAPGDLIRVKGKVLEGFGSQPRSLQRKRTKTWGTNGEREMPGGHGGRNIIVPVVIYDDAEISDFSTARKLADYLDYTLNTNSLQRNGTLKVYTVSDHSEFLDCTFDGAEIMPGESIKLDEGGALGGKYFSVCILRLYQLSSGFPQPAPPPTP